MKHRTYRQIFNNQLFQYKKMGLEKQAQINQFQQQNLQKNLQIDNQQVGKWTDDQNLKYAIFMDFHKFTLSSRQKKKNFRLFQEMSKFIGSRSTVQCRSHHQKLEQRFKNFKKIISAVKNQVGRKQYKVQYSKWTNSGEKLIYVLSKLPQKLQTFKQQNQQKHFQTVQNEKAQIHRQPKPQEISVTPTYFPFYHYQPFQNVYSYSFPNFYQFRTSYF